MLSVFCLLWYIFMEYQGFLVNIHLFCQLVSPYRFNWSLSPSAISSLVNLISRVLFFVSWCSVSLKFLLFFFLAKMEVLILGCQATDSYKCMLLTTVLPTYGLTKLSNKTDPDVWLTGLSLVYRQPPAADPLLPGECKHDSKQSTSKTSQFCNKPFCFG